MSAGAAASTRAQTASAKPRNSASLATKSVSQLTSTIATRRAGPSILIAITPSAVILPALFSAFA